MKQQSIKVALVKSYSKLVKNIRKFQKEDPAITAIEKQRDKEYMNALKAVSTFIKEHTYVEIVDALQKNSGQGWHELRDVFNDTHAELIA